jgi:hypothetical protein
MKNVIKNIEKLSGIFETDEIPSFHDAEILSILLNRENNVSIEAVLRIYRLTKEYKIGEKKITHGKNAYAKFRFYEVKLDSLKNFYHQNVIDDLNISREEDSDFFTVHFQSIIGCDLKFSCKEIELMEIRVSESQKESASPN